MHRVIIFANIVQIDFDALHFILIIFEKLCKIISLISINSKIN